MARAPGRPLRAKLDHRAIALGEGDDGLDEPRERRVLVLGVHPDAGATLERGRAEHEPVGLGHVLEGELERGRVAGAVRDRRRARRERVVEEEFARMRELVGGGRVRDGDAVNTARESIQHLQGKKKKKRERKEQN